MMVAQGQATARYTELTGQARRFIVRVMNAVAKRGVNRFSRGTATKPATIMPAMKHRKIVGGEAARLGKTSGGAWPPIRNIPARAIAIQDEERGEPDPGEERQRQDGEIDD